MTAPLAKLLTKNVAEAASLSLVTAGATDLIKLNSDVDQVWLEPLSEIDRFYRASSLLHARLHGQTVTLGSFRAKSIAITRVFPIRDIEYLFVDVLRSSDPVKKRLIQQALGEIQIAAAVVTTNAPSAIEDAALKEANLKMDSSFDVLRSQVCALGSAIPSVSIYARALVQPGRACWVGRRPNLRGGTSQQWRDRLGLEHYPHSEGKRWSPSLGDRLVRVTFMARTSQFALHPTEAQNMLRTHPKDLWLVRPTVTHVGNSRFVQRHHSDRDGIPLKQGRTIDIKDRLYEQGERELILYHGATAKVAWHDAELLEGIPQRNAHDLDHGSFVNVIGSRYGW